ncbi:MAG TPA: hypothetical protein VFD91_14045 [Mariniphaga sp.]|nr:hypothetical protein [Mariniphaga sp.]
METKPVFLTGSFKNLESAERAYKRLRERGYSDNDINIIMSEDSMKNYFNDDKSKESKIGNKAKEGAGTGATVGGVIGATAGIVAAIGTSLLIPGLGIVIAGPVAAGLAGAGAGGITGGIIGALVGAGMPKERALKYEQGIKEGDIVLAVEVRNEEDARYFEEEWANYGNNIYR